MGWHRWGAVALALCVASAWPGMSSQAGEDDACSVQDTLVEGDRSLSIECGSQTVKPTLKVVKQLIPDNDPGKFNLRIDGAIRATNAGNMGTTGQVSVSLGTHTVSESAGTGTNPLEYAASFSGACNSAGLVTLTAGQNKICTITNRRRRWSNKALMPGARAFFGTGAIGNAIYVVGGVDGPGFDLGDLLKYSTTGNSWTTKAPLPTPRRGAAVGVVSGILYAVGGRAATSLGFATLATVDAYDPSTNSWTSRAPMPGVRAGHAVAVLNGKLYAAGGDDGTTAFATLYVYNPVSNVWPAKAPMPAARTALALAALNGKLYAVGGAASIGGSSSATLYQYDPGTNTWATKPAMPTPRQYLAATAANGVLYVLGGYQAGAVYAKAEAYDPLANSWSTISPMLTARTLLGAEAVNDVVYALGGVTAQITVFAKIEAYGP